MSGERIEDLVQFLERQAEHQPFNRRVEARKFKEAADALRNSRRAGQEEMREQVAKYIERIHGRYDLSDEIRKLSPQSQPPLPGDAHV